MYPVVHTRCLGLQLRTSRTSALATLMQSDFRHTRPVTGLSLAREDAYDTDWGMSMLATVIPARKSPANLRRRVSQCVLGRRKVRTERTSTGVSKRWRGRSIELLPMSTFSSITEGGRPNLSEG